MARVPVTPFITGMLGARVRREADDGTLIDASEVMHDCYGPIASSGIR
jgi:hypothetical protein